MFRRAKKEIDLHPGNGVWLSSGRSIERWAPRSPSIEIQLLKMSEPRLYDAEPGRLCISSSKNFCGTLFYALFQESFLHDLRSKSYLSEHDFTAPDELALPFRLLRDVPLSFYEPARTRYIPANKTAPLVLFKQAIGTEAGVILQGTMAGTILDKKDDLPDPSHGMIINRVWNDELIHEHSLPYSPRYIVFKQLLQKENALELDTQFQEHFFQFLKKEKLTQPAWTTTVFFALCEKLGIPVDKKNFYYLRSKEAIAEKSNLRRTR